MQAEALATLAFLDTRLPKNSTVVMMGLADGRILYESLHNRIHPIGKLRGDVTYSQLYDFLNCLEISPCRGWMNSNETLRNATTERAEQLSMVLEQITLEHKFTNFKAHYIPNVFKDGIAEWVAEGREAWELIEPGECSELYPNIPSCRITHACAPPPKWTDSTQTKSQTL